MVPEGMMDEPVCVPQTACIVTWRAVDIVSIVLSAVTPASDASLGDKRLHGTTRGYSDITPKAGSDRLQKSAKNFLGALKLISFTQISTKSMGQIILN